MHFFFIVRFTVQPPFNFIFVGHKGGVILFFFISTIIYNGLFVHFGPQRWSRPKFSRSRSKVNILLQPEDAQGQVLIIKEKVKFLKKIKNVPF